MVQFTGSGSCFLYDLDSRNGTMLNGQRVSAPTLLRHGDRITIGPYDLGFVQDETVVRALADMQASAADALALAEQQQVTTVVINIRDYAGLERCLGVVRVADVVAALHQEAREILEDMDVWTQKHLGPTILAIWVHRSMKVPLNVVLSAFESVSRIARAAGALQGRFGLDVAVQISAGLETGKASLTGLDSRGSSDLGALDDAVNRAFRNYSTATELDREIAFGAATGEILSQGVALRDLAQQYSVKLNGAAEPAALWLMSLDSLSRMLMAQPVRTVRMKIP